MSETEETEMTEDETTEDEYVSSEESMDEKYFKTDRYKPRPTKSRNSSGSKVRKHYVTSKFTNSKNVQLRMLAASRLSMFLSVPTERLRSREIFL